MMYIGMQMLFVFTFTIYFSPATQNVLNRLGKTIDESIKELSRPAIWAVLVAGSDGWYNYRHQADVCRAYQLLLSHGVQREKIITMMYDDIAHNKENNYRGKIFNEPNGTDVYAGVKIDYRRGAVTPENFIAVITGNKSAVKGGSGRVLESTVEENVFINFVDHGGSGILSFPNDVLTVKELMKALKKMHKKRMYRRVVFYTEACESGSMFQSLASDLNIYSVTASNSKESSYACYCDNTMKLPCLGDCFSVNWMVDTEYRNVDKETLNLQYHIVKEETNTSHVSLYGKQDIGTDVVAEYQGHRKTYKLKSLHAERNQSRKVMNRNVYIYELKREARQAESLTLKKTFIKQLLKALKKRSYMDDFMLKFVSSFVSRFIANDRKASMARLFAKREKPITEFDCHHTVVKNFHKTCFNFGINPYALNFVHILTNICHEGVELSKIEDIMVKLCAVVSMSNIH